MNSSNTATGDTGWPYCSSFYDPNTMHARSLRQILDSVECTGKSKISYLEVVDGETCPVQTLDLSDEKSKLKFEADVGERKPTLSAYTNLWTQEGRLRDTRVDVGLDRPSWEWLWEHADIHPRWIDLFPMHQAYFAFFSSHDDDSGAPTAFHILLRLPATRQYLSTLYFRHSFDPSQRSILVTSSASHTFSPRLLSHLSSTCRRGLPRQPLESNPFGLVLALVSQHYEIRAANKHLVALELMDLERDTGRGTSFMPESYRPDPEGFNVERMHRIGSWLRRTAYEMQCQVRTGAALIAAHEQFLRLRGAAHPASRALHEPLDSRLREALDAHAMLTREAVEHMSTLEARAVVQIEIANSLVTTSIATQSRAVAIETRKDSTAMKTIAALTMVYLPSTFAATVCSLGFFKWTDAGGTRLTVYPNIWIFAVICAVLTALTAAAWLALSCYGPLSPCRPAWMRREAASEPRAPGRATERKML